MRDSVTVSIGDDTSGVFNINFFVSADESSCKHKPFSHNATGYTRSVADEFKPHTFFMSSLICPEKIKLSSNVASLNDQLGGKKFVSTV